MNNYNDCASVPMKQALHNNKMHSIILRVYFKIKYNFLNIYLIICVNMLYLKVKCVLFRVIRSAGRKIFFFFFLLCL